MPNRLPYAYTLPLLHTIPVEETEQVADAIRYWTDIPGLEISVGSQQFPPYQFDGEGIESYRCLLHIDSLNADTIRIELEAKVLGPDPIIQIVFGAAGNIGMTPSIPVPMEGEWKLYQFTVSRPEIGVALGKHLDMFTYSGRDIDVRSFKAIDLGQKGDVNLDQVVNALDLLVVAGNYAQEGNIGIEGGDTNLDGVVNTADVLNVINGIE